MICLSLFILIGLLDIVLAGFCLAEKAKQNPGSAEIRQYKTLNAFKGSISPGEEGSLSFGERRHFQLAKGTFLIWPDRVFFMCFIQISPAFAEKTDQRPPVLFKKAFKSYKLVKSAELSITAHGLYEANINGKRVGDGYFTPGYTAYKKRLQYQTYDVKALLRQRNEISVTVGDGWYRGHFGNGGPKNNYGSDVSLLLTLNINYTDGTTQTIQTDHTWQVTTGPIQNSDLYDGETIDANIRPQNRQTVKVAAYSKDNLVPTTETPVKKLQVIAPKAILPGNIIDFGQNLAGWVRFSWAKGRVALVGDAGYCASPAAGRGGSLAIDGAAALAGAFHNCHGDFEAALKNTTKAFAHSSSRCRQMWSIIIWMY